MPDNDTNQTEGPLATTDYYTIADSDANLVKKINSFLSTNKPDHEKRVEEGKRNERYWGDDQLKGISLRWHNSRIVQNRIYLGVETMVPIMTSKPAEPIVSAANDKKVSKESADKLGKMLIYKYDNDNQQLLFQTISRHLLLNKIGVLKIIWDDEIDDYYIDFVHPNKVVLSSTGYRNEDVEVAEYLEKPLHELIKMYPDKEQELLGNFAPGITAPEAVLGTPVGFWEYWPANGEYLVWKMQNVILQKKLNPYFKWKESEDGKKAENKLTSANHFKYPRKPYMFFNSQNLGRHIWDDTTPVSQCIPIQDGINLLHRIITDTAADQGILIGAQEFIGMEELYKYTGGPAEKLSVKGGDATRALHRLPPKQLQQGLMDMLLHLEAAADNIMGTHSTTRGEKSSNPTFGQDQMAKESDYGRIDGIVRGLEKVADELYNWEAQMMKIKYTKDHYMSVLGGQDAAIMDKFKGDNVEDNISITVKQGSTLPTDKVSQRNDAIEMAKVNKIDDITFFERMDFPNPRESAKRLFMQIKYPEMLFPEIKEELKKDAEAKAKKGEGDGSVQPPADQVNAALAGGAGAPVVPTQPKVPQPPLMSQPEATPPAQPVSAQALAVPQQTQGTEHTARLIKGERVQPFDGVEPSPLHVSNEFVFMTSPEFNQLPEQIQAIIAEHALKEKRLLEGNQQPQPQAQSQPQGQPVIPNQGAV